MKKFKGSFLIALTLLLIYFTPKFNELANIDRVTPGYGGECLIWIMPFLFCAFYKIVIKGTIRDLKEVK